MSAACRLAKGRRFRPAWWQHQNQNQGPRTPLAQQQPWRRRLQGLPQRGQRSRQGLRKHRMAAAHHQHVHQTARQHCAHQPLAVLTKATQCLLAVQQVRALLLLAAMLCMKQPSCNMPTKYVHAGAPHHRLHFLESLLPKIWPKNSFYCSRYTSRNISLPSVGASVSVFGIEALKAQIKRPREGLIPDQVKLDDAANKRLRVEDSAAAIAELPAKASMVSSVERLGTQSSAASRPEPAGQEQANGASTPAGQSFTFSTPNGTQSSTPRAKPPLQRTRPNSSRCSP